jgi:hypothetical protein
MKIIEQEEWSYTLFQDGSDGQYYLETVCGTIGVFSLTIRLDPDEVAEMKADPAFVKHLAQKITYSPRRYLERRVPDIDLEPKENEL